jgi:hypothetical protein
LFHIYTAYKSIVQALKYYRAVEHVAADKMETHLVGFEGLFD